MIDLIKGKALWVSMAGFLLMAGLYAQLRFEVYYWQGEVDRLQGNYDILQSQWQDAVIQWNTEMAQVIEQVNTYYQNSLYHQELSAYWQDESDKWQGMYQKEWQLALLRHETIEALNGQVSELSEERLKLEAENAVYVKAYNATWFKTLTELSDWVAEKGYIIIADPKADCDDYAPMFMKLALKDGYIMPMVAVNGGKVFNTTVVPFTQPHVGNWTFIGNKMYFVEPQPVDDYPRIVYIGERD